MTNWLDGSSALRAAWKLDQPWIEAAARGARFTNSGDPTFDNLAILQACCDELGSGTSGGTIILPAGIGYISNQLIVRNATIIRGQGNGSTLLRAMTTATGSPTNFPSSTPVVKLGDLETDSNFHIRLEDMSVNAQGVSGSTCVYSRWGNEGTGVSHFSAEGYKLYGVHANCMRFDVEEAELYGAAGAVAGYYMQSMGVFATANKITTSDATHGIWSNGSPYTISDIHSERCTNGVYSQNSSGVISEVTALVCTNAVHFDNTTAWGMAIGTQANGCTYSILDDLDTGAAITDIYVPIYVRDSMYIGTRMKFGSSTAGRPSTSNYRPGGTGIVLNYQAQAGAPVGWVTTSGGAPDTWRPFGMVYGGAIHAIPYSASMTPDFGPGGGTPDISQFQTITVTNGTAMTINAPVVSFAYNELWTGQELTLDILNSSGGAMGAITWNATYKMAGAFVNPANTKRRTISFYYNGTNWIETSRAAADI